MKFIDVILNNSDLNEAKLYSASHKCLEKPDTGITIQHKGAYNVIRDCAKITTRYLPHYVFGAYTKPFQILKGKVTKPDIEEFVKKSRDDYALNQLLSIIIEKYKSENNVLEQTTPSFIENTIDTNDPYGYYGMNDEIEDVSTPKVNDVDMLCKAFSV